VLVLLGGGGVGGRTLAQQPTKRLIVETEPAELFLHHNQRVRTRGSPLSKKQELWIILKKGGSFNYIGRESRRAKSLQIQ